MIVFTIEMKVTLCYLFEYYPLFEGTSNCNGINFTSFELPHELSRNKGTPDTSGSAGCYDISKRKNPLQSRFIYSPMLSTSICCTNNTFSDTFFMVVRLKSKKI